MTETAVKLSREWILYVVVPMLRGGYALCRIRTAGRTKTPLARVLARVPASLVWVARAAPSSTEWEVLVCKYTGPVQARTAERWFRGVLGLPLDDFLTMTVVRYPWGLPDQITSNFLAGRLTESGQLARTRGEAYAGVSFIGLLSLAEFTDAGSLVFEHGESFPVSIVEAVGRQPTSESRAQQSARVALAQPRGTRKRDPLRSWRYENGRLVRNE